MSANSEKVQDTRTLEFRELCLTLHMQSC